MIEYKSGDLLREDAEALVNTVNCVGVMGRGIALQFKKAFPGNFDAYAAACKLNQVKPGEMFVFSTGQLTNPRFIVNFPTKRHWRGKSLMEDIECGLKALVALIRSQQIGSIAVPPLGSGLGGLSWPLVKERIELALAPLADVRVVIYEPLTTPFAGEMTRSSKAPKMTAGRAALLTLMQRYLTGLLDPFITLLELHKLMYFLQEAGEPLNLKFKKAHYGPYAENLRHVLHALEGHLIQGYADGGDNPVKQLTLLPGALEKARSFLEEQPQTQARLESVANLVSGFESPFGLELLATVHWVIKNDKATAIDKITDEVYGWNPGKSKFTERQIKLAADLLTENPWVFEAATTS